MNINNFKKTYPLLLASILFLLFGVASLAYSDIPHRNNKTYDYFKEFPWVGLITNEICYGPIAISNVNLNNQSKLVYVKPNEEIIGCLNYTIDASRLESMHLYHLVVGISSVGAQDCITHTFGVWNNSGVGHFRMIAPSKPGVYQVKFNYSEGLSCQAARNNWNAKNSEASSAATIAAIIVE